MAAKGAHKVTADFEKALAEYTGAPYVVCVDNCSNALFLALMHYGIKNKAIYIPANTYPSVPCEIVHAGGKVDFFAPRKDGLLRGAYQLWPTPVYDSALRFTWQMYKPNTYMCVSFTGARKILKLEKGGAILTDDRVAYEWFKRARFSGRRECSYHEDVFNFETSGWNFWMMPSIAARGLMMMEQLYDFNGTPLDVPDLELPYPDLSRAEHTMWRAAK